jgi:hypothetical protein
MSGVPDTRARPRAARPVARASVGWPTWNSNNVNQACSTWSDADKQLADSLDVNNSQQGGSS